MNLIVRVTYITIFSFAFSKTSCQPNWKLSRDKEGIRVYLSENPKSKFKSIKVECTLQGTFDKLISVLTDVGHFNNWVYSTKSSYIVKKISPLDFYYYTETFIPWPMSNRDLVIHLKIIKDSLQRFIRITSINENGLMPEKDGKVRVIYFAANWYVTMPTQKTISIVYTIDIDPGGSLPAWLVNSIADKGPYETFKKLSGML
ncbi:MAG TPA: START domain-containing protein [Chitinophagaceae bacterium]